MKRLQIVILAIVCSMCIAKAQEVVYLSTADFKEKVFDYTDTNEWCYKGELPCVIDFYATWCGPCKIIAPTLTKLADDYKGKVIFYKVDVDKEKELSYYFGIRSIPTLLFCPQNGKPQIAQGALPETAIAGAIKEVLLK